MSKSFRVVFGPVLAIVSGLAILAAAIAANFLLPVRYEAFALLKVSRQPPAVLDEPPTSFEEFSTYKRTQAQLIVSPMVLARTLGEPDIAELPTVSAHGDEAAAWLNSHLIVDFPDEAEIMRVALRGTSPDDLKVIVQGIVNKYLMEVVRHQREMKVAQEERLDRTLHLLLGKLVALREMLHKIEVVERTPTVEAAVVAKKMALEQLEQLTAQRSKFTEAIIDVETRIHMMEAREQHPDEADARQPEVEVPLSKDDVIGVVNQKLTSATEELADAPEDRWSDDSLEMLKERRSYYRQKLEDLKDKIEQQALCLEKLETFSSRVAAKQDELRALEKVTDEVREKLDLMRIERDAPARISLLDDAIALISRVDAREQHAALALAGLVGLGLIVAGAWRWPRRADRDE